jgi:2-iminobutanoate/2-iminopropanoate deaminase
MKIIHTDKAPKAIGPYSQAIEAGKMLFVSGQIPVNPTTNELANNDIKSQTLQSLTNLKEIIEKAGFNMSQVVKCNVFLQSMNDFKEMNEVYASFFNTTLPARCAIEVAKLPRNALVEIDAICCKE